MAPKKKSPAKNMRKKVVMDLAQKMKVIELLKNGEKVASIAKRFVVNESTIRWIRDNMEKIIGSASKLGAHAKCCKITRAIRRYNELYRDMVRCTKQKTVTDYFKRS